MAKIKTDCTCLQCGKIFKGFSSTATKPASKYCSRTCMAQGFSIKVKCTCQQCGRSFEVQPCIIRTGGGKYCGRECATIAQHTQVDRTCLQCGKVFKCDPSRVKKGSGKYCSKRCLGLANVTHPPIACEQCGKSFSPRATSKYCSQECMGIARSKKVKLVCAYCGKIRMMSPSAANSIRGKYCSQECMGLDRQGDKSPRWRGGDVDYGENWITQRNLAYRRDGGVCQHCRRKQRKGEKQFDVHHIVKHRLFNGDYKSANSLTNLITLCRKCHGKAEYGKIVMTVRLF